MICCRLLTGGELSPEEIVTAVTTTLPHEWKQHLGRVPPRFVTAVLMYPEAASLEYLSKQARFQAPAELQR